MDKHEALDWFLRRKSSIGLSDKCQSAEDIAIECIMQSIEAQEPRVLTLEEARNNAYSFYYTPDSVKPVFVQFRDETYADESMTPPWRGGLNQRALLKDPDRYGTDYVFWTDRPSEEQRKDVEWQ